jgi:hypothetical protein
MARILRVIRLSAVSLSVGTSLGFLAAALAWASDDGASGSGSRSSTVGTRPTGHRGAPIVTIQQKNPKKKRGKRATPKQETPAEAPENAVKPSDAGALKFSRDIAPIIVANCTGCHNPNPPQKKIKLDMTTFEKMMAGTPNGRVIEPGKPEESHLVLRIKGEETPRMPQGGNRVLSADTIGRIESWVKAGAALDPGIDPKAKLETYAASPEELRKLALGKMPAEERDRQVEKVGLERWKKADPKVKPAVTPSTHFVLFGTLSKDRANAALKAVEAQYAPARSLFGAAGLDWGEKASVFVLNDALSFSELVRALEGRDVETGDVATAKFDVPQPYIAVVDPLGGRDDSGGASKKVGRSRRGEEDPGGAERSLPGLITERLVIGAAAVAGKPPKWLRLGLGALMASRVDGRSRYYTKIRRQAYETWELGWISKANDALGGESKNEEIRAVGFAILEWLVASDRAILARYVQAMLKGGDKLDEVNLQVLQLSREDFLVRSGMFIEQRYGRLR